MLSLPRRRRDLAVALTALIVIIGTAAPGYDALAQRMDDGALLLYPELILKGWVPYRDFETFYGPANPYLLAGVYRIFGPGIFVLRTVGLIFHCALLAAIFFTVRPRGDVLAFCSVFIAHLLLLPTGLTPFPWLGALSCALWGLYLAGRPANVKQILAAGMLGAIALLFRPDLALAVLLSNMLVLLYQPAKNRLCYLLGFAIALLPMFALLLTAGFQNVFDNLFLYPVVVTNAARRLPGSSVNPHLHYLLVLHVVASAVSAVVGFRAMQKETGSWANRLFTAAAIFSLGTTHQALQRMDSGHVTLCCFLSLALFPVALAIIFDRWKPAIVAQVRPLLFGAVPLVLILLLAPELPRNIWRSMGLGGPSRKDNLVFVEHRNRRFPVDSISMAADISVVLDRVSVLASPGQRLFVGPADLRRTNYNDTFIYYLLPQLTPATYFLEMNPLSANRPGSRLSNDLLTADWLILDHQLDVWDEPNESSKFGPDTPNDVVLANFELIATRGPFEIYRRKS